MFGSRKLDNAKENAKMTVNRFTNFSIGLCVLAFATTVVQVAQAQVQEVRGVLLNEILPAPGGLPTIAVDSLDRPHIVADRGLSRARVNVFDRVGVASPWVDASFDAAATSYRSSQFWNPHLEIVNGIAYCSGIVFGDSIGMGTVVRSGMDTAAPSAPIPGYSVRRIQGAWDAGEGSVDPGNGDYIISSGAGIYKAYGYDAAESYGLLRWRYEGQMYAGAGGEKNASWVSKARPVAHRYSGVHAVWHGAIGGYNRYESSYQNSVRHEKGLPPVAWAAFRRYQIMEDDGTYVDVKSDAEEPERAYMTSAFVNGQGGVCVNIFNPATDSMLFPTDACLTVDADGWSGLRRFAPQMAPAKGGGVWISWTGRGGVYVRYISPFGIMGNEYRVGDGERANVCVDSEGFLHVVYSSYASGKLQYVKLDVTGTSGRGIADYDGDGISDYAVYNGQNGKWNVHSSDGSRPLNNAQWGWPSPAVKGLHGDFDGDGKSDLAVYDMDTGKWYVHSSNGTRPVNGAQWGWNSPSVFPVPADYDGDGMADLAVYDTATGKWYVHSSSGRRFMTGAQWGWQSTAIIPVAADYDGDRMADLAVYDTATGKWYVHSSSGRRFMTGAQWGWQSTTLIPVPADYDGDGMVDLTVYNTATGKWHVHPNDTPVDWGGAVGDLPPHRPIDVLSP
jgi:hypothetical protein